MTTIEVRPSGGPSQLIAAEIRAELGRQQLSNRRLALMIGGGVSYAWVNRRINACDVDLRAVQELLGHSKPETTARYVATPDGALKAAVAGVTAA